MTDRNKFEEMLERLIAEDRAGAEELFHEIVVEKSREIYKSIIEAEDMDEEDMDEEIEEASEEDDMDEAMDMDEEDMDEMFGLGEEGDEMDMGGDETDDMMHDVEAGHNDMEADNDQDSEILDKVEDIEDAIDALKAEFEKLMGDHGEAGDDEGEMEFGGEEEGEEEPEHEEEKEEAFSFESSTSRQRTSSETMREYVEKVTAKMGDNGANTKSTVAGKNDMGGTTANIAKGGEADTKGTKGGLLDPSTKEMNAGNVNVPGGKASKSMKAMPKGHGAEKKGASENAANKQSVIRGK